MTFGEKAADLIASAGRSWTFLIALNAGMGVYMVSQNFMGHPFDPYPYILLNLGLSWMAANQAPVIMMSQGRLDDLQRQQIQMQTETLQAILVILKSLEDKIEEDMEDIEDELRELRSKK